MATTIDVTDQPRPDLYRPVHKGLRFALFNAAIQAGACDATDDGEVTALLDTVANVVDLLRQHAGHEDRVLDPLIHRHAADVEASIHAAHEASEATLDALVDLCNQIEGATQRRALVDGLYDQLCDFTAEYLGHLRQEEGEVMPALHAAMSDVELLDVRAAIQGSISPPQMCQSIEVIMPAVNVTERRAMLGGMRAAPPHIFELFEDAVRNSLDTAAWSQLQQGVSA